MAYNFTLTGNYATSPVTGPMSGFPMTQTPIQELMQFRSAPITPEFLLTDDTVHVVDLCGLAAVNVLALKVVGSKITLRVTSTDGADQAIPVDGFFIDMTRTVPITALSIQRLTGGVQTTVSIFMGERA